MTAEYHERDIKKLKVEAQLIRLLRRHLKDEDAEDLVREFAESILQVTEEA